MQIFAKQGTVNIQGWIGRVVVRGGIRSCSDERVAATPTRTDPVRCLCGAGGARHQQTDGQAAATEQQCLDFEGRREEPVHKRQRRTTQRRRGRGRGRGPERTQLWTLASAARGGGTAPVWFGSSGQGRRQKSHIMADCGQLR